MRSGRRSRPPAGSTRRARGLHPVLGLAEDRRHLRAGVGRRHADRAVRSQRDRLAEPDRRSAAEGDDEVRPGAGIGRHRPLNG